MRQRLAFALVLACASIAGCTAQGDKPDPWAYTKKPLYAGGFDLARIAGQSDAQQFRVTDGSIAAIQAFVWINATQGGATVTLRDPFGKAMLTTSQTTQTQLGLNLGEWQVVAEGYEGSAGVVHVLVVRA